MSFDRAQSLVSHGDRIVIGVSSGPDSVCLAHHLARLASARRLRLAIVHIHHGLRGPAANADAEFVRTLAGELKMPFYQRKIPVKRVAARERRSLEDAARLLRYRALAQIAKRLSCNKVALGHHLDDQAETVLLHLLRGKKAKGLAGIPVKRALATGITIIRPLMALTRKEIELYLKAYGLDSRADETNSSLEFTRNWVRHEVLPMLEKRNPRMREHLAAIARDVRRALRID